jgi:CHAD domain-containing protein
MLPTLTPDRDLLPQLRDLACEYNRHSLQTLMGKQALSPGTVHDTRVTVKRLRALWQLMKPFYGSKNVRRSDHNLRDAARALSGARDLHVMQKTLRQLRDHTRREYELEALDSVRERIFPGEPEAVRPPRPEEVVAALRADLERWQTLALDIDDKTLVKDGFGRTYRRARTLGFDALTGDAPEPWHEFRKWAKYLFYQMEPLAPALEKNDLRPEDLNKLGKKLGKLHDLHVLLDELGAQERKHTPEDVAIIIQVMRRREAQLLGDCQNGARNCFSAKPKAFQRELLKAWEAWRGQSA